MYAFATKIKEKIRSRKKASKAGVEMKTAWAQPNEFDNNMVVDDDKSTIYQRKTKFALISTHKGTGTFASWVCLAFSSFVPLPLGLFNSLHFASTDRTFLHFYQAAATRKRCQKGSYTF